MGKCGRPTLVSMISCLVFFSSLISLIRIETLCAVQCPLFQTTTCKPILCANGWNKHAKCLRICILESLQNTYVLAEKFRLVILEIFFIPTWPGTIFEQAQRRKKNWSWIYVPKMILFLKSRMWVCPGKNNRCLCDPYCIQSEVDKACKSIPSGAASYIEHCRGTGPDLESENVCDCESFDMAKVY